MSYERIDFIDQEFFRSDNESLAGTMFYEARDETGLMVCIDRRYDPHLINHGDSILKGEIDLTRILQMCLTVIVPYIVSTVSSVSTLMSMEGGIKIHEDPSVKTS